jgi:hypothetical protein
MSFESISIFLESGSSVSAELNGKDLEGIKSSLSYMQ